MGGWGEGRRERRVGGRGEGGKGEEEGRGGEEEERERGEIVLSSPSDYHA